MKKDFLNDTLFPALFDRLDTALPEFHFRLKHKGDGRRLWESRAGMRPDGHQGKEAGKAFVDERTPFYLGDLNPIRARSIWRYVKEREGLDTPGTFRRLCELAEVQIKDYLTPDEVEKMEAAQRRAEVLEAANAFLLEQLHTHKSEAADRARRYLEERGYLLRELRQEGQGLKDDYTGGERMEIGYLPNLPDLEPYLKEYKMAPSKAAGRVSLTLRERGRIVGFAFRAVDGSEPKYLALEGYEKAKHLPGLTRAENIVLVEGYLDAMSAHAAGFLNVAALGGVSLSEAQIEAALRAGARSLTLALDNDAAGHQATREAVETLLRYHEKTGKEFGVFVCQYPQGVKDLDELLRQEGGREAAAEILRLKMDAPRYLSAWLDNVRAPEIAAAVGGYSTDTFRAELVREVAQIERIVRPIDAPRLRQLLEPFYKTWGIDADGVKAAADIVRQNEAEKRYRAELRTLAKKAGEALDSGKIEEAENLLWKDAKEARLRLHSGRFASLLDGQTKEAVAAELARLNGGLQTPYELYQTGREPVNLEFPAGAISVIAAPSSHGKTAFLINSILELCPLYPDKEFHFFTLEESAAAVTAKMLNTFLDMEISGRNESAIEHYLKGEPKFIRGEMYSEMKEKEPEFWALLGARFFVHYLEDATAESFCEAVRWLHKRRNIGGVFADYIQLFRLQNPGRLNRQEEVKAFCTLFKETAVETGLPLIFAAQFNREVTSEAATHDYTKIREAGDIEHVAAVILGLWNREFTKPKKDESGKETGGPSPMMAAKILKWRGGPVGHGAAWNYNGNRKRIYPGPLEPQKMAAPKVQKAPF